jgi:hypothetical protein
MTIKLINKTVLHCKCVLCGWEWDTFAKPKRCSSCKRYRWNGEDNRMRDPLENVPRGSTLPTEIPEVRNKDILDVLILTRAILEQVISDFGPCDHPKECVCHEKSVLDKMNKQIDLLSQFGVRSATYVRHGKQLKPAEKATA